MSFKIAFIGAGSLGFTRRLLGDLLTVPEFSDCEVAFTDINEQNLDMVYKICQRDIAANKLPVKLTKTLDRREAVKDAKYVIVTVRVGGVEAFATDVEIPLQYGVDQCVGDTLCAGGIMYGQRGIAAMLSFCKDIKELSRPDVLLLNYANPNAQMTWAANVFGGVKCVGLCHGVQGGHEQLAQVIEVWAKRHGKIAEDEKVTKKDVDIICAGINHQTWYIQAKWRGMDMLPHLLEGFENHPTYKNTEKVRIDMLRRFGYYSTESNGHLSEYLPWYRKRPDEIEKWIDTSAWINGETGGYLRVCTENRNWFDTEFPKLLAEEATMFVPEKRSIEHGSYIIEGLETGRVYRGHFNVVNSGTITNLPNDAIVEVPGYVDRNGMNIPRVGDLPLGAAAVCTASISVQRMSVIAAVTGDDNLLRQAMMMDPLTGAVCNPPEIWQMTDDMLVAGEKWLPQYEKAIKEAKRRRLTDERLPVKEGYRGAVRLHTKSVEEMRLAKAK
ncbi:MAG: alpha-glucosidase/alpha-galactosidase [Spirochaetota bacterium]